MQCLEAFWQKGACSVREVQEAFPESGRPAYTTVQTVVYRLERKKALRIAKPTIQSPLVAFRLIPALQQASVQ
jgi:predicted transcriptional regulator